MKRVLRVQQSNSNKKGRATLNNLFVQGFSSAWIEVTPQRCAKVFLSENANHQILLFKVSLSK